MRAINHALTGAIIGLTVSEPLLAAPLAFASHFVCDVIPHFGKDGSKAIGYRWFVPVLAADAILCVGLAVLLIITRPTHWLSALLCSFLATSPDLFSLPRLLRQRRGQSPEPNLRRPFVRFHHTIQWFERPVGAVVEAVWFIGSTVVFWALIT